MEGGSNNHHGGNHFKAATDAEEKPFPERFMSTNPEITVNDHPSSNHIYQSSLVGQTGLPPSRKTKDLGRNIEVPRMSTSCETLYSPNRSPVSPPNIQPMQTTANSQPLLLQTKAEAVSQELAADVVQNLNCGSLAELEQAIKARVLRLLNSNRSRKRKAETAGVVETPDPKRRVSCDQCSKTMVRRCDLRYHSLSEAV